MPVHFIAWIGVRREVEQVIAGAAPIPQLLPPPLLKYDSLKLTIAQLLRAAHTQRPAVARHFLLNTLPQRSG